MILVKQQQNLLIYFKIKCFICWINYFTKKWRWSKCFEYVYLGEPVGIVKLKSSRDIGSTIIQFTRRAGGMIVNGDIYTWGNNGNKITGINLTHSGATGAVRYSSNYRYGKNESKIKWCKF